jgi:hypothetical protein
MNEVSTHGSPESFSIPSSPCDTSIYYLRYMQLIDQSHRRLLEVWSSSRPVSPSLLWNLEGTCNTELRHEVKTYICTSSEEVSADQHTLSSLTKLKFDFKVHWHHYIDLQNLKERLVEVVQSTARGRQCSGKARSCCQSAETRAFFVGKVHNTLQFFSRLLIFKLDFTEALFSVVL